MTELHFMEAYEVPLLVPRAREFFAEGHLAGTFNPDHWVAWLMKGISQGSVIVVSCGVPVRGAIGAALYADPATGDQCAAELFWYVGASERGTVGLKLLKTLEGALVRLKVKRLHLVHLADGEPMGAVFARLGYRPLEHIHVKEFP